MSVQGSVTLNAVGNSNAMRVNLNQFRRGVGLVCTVNIGNASALSYSVQVTGDRVSSAPPVNWNNHDILQNLSASANDSLRYPCSAIRLVVNSVTTPGNVAWTGGVTLSQVAQFD